MGPTQKNGCKGDYREGDQDRKITLDRVFTFLFWNRVNKARIASSARRDWSRFPDIPEVNIDNLKVWSFILELTSPNGFQTHIFWFQRLLAFCFLRDAHNLFHIRNRWKAMINNSFVWIWWNLMKLSWTCTLYKLNVTYFISAYLFADNQRYRGIINEN